MTAGAAVEEEAVEEVELTGEVEGLRGSVAEVLEGCEELETVEVETEEGAGGGRRGSGREKEAGMTGLAGSGVVVILEIEEEVMGLYKVGVIVGLTEVVEFTKLLDIIVLEV